MCGGDVGREERAGKEKEGKRKGREEGKGEEVRAESEEEILN